MGYLSICGKITETTEIKIRELTSLHSRSTFAGKRVLLGVTGGIAAYKAAVLLREFQKLGATVQVVMTEQAQQFVGSMTFAALTNMPVRTSLNDEQAELSMGHIELARWADVFIIAPASANTIAKLAYGIADNLLTTIALASEKPLFVAPAMNQKMWAHTATQENIATLRQRGIAIIGPGNGEQACGDVGSGRMSEPEEIVATIAAQMSADVIQAPELSGSNAGDLPLLGKKVMLTAGPTREPIDPVRYISNHSSGRMGYALAEQFALVGAEVTLVSGPVCLQPPAGVTKVSINSAEQLLAAVMARISEQDIFVSVAAVADYRPATVAEQKMKKNPAAINSAEKQNLQIELTENPDILRTVSGLMHDRPFCVGFAAETEKVVEHARNKLLNKRLDMICANQVGSEQIGFGDKPNALEVLWQDGSTSIAMTDKTDLARQLVPVITERYCATITS